MSIFNARSLLVAGLLSIGAIAVAPMHDAEATTLAPMTDQQMTDASTLIVRGTVEKVWVERSRDDTIWTRAKIRVAQAIKGANVPEFVVVDSLGGEIDGTIASVHGTARFSVGEDTLVYLDELRPGRYTPVAMFMGKYTIRRAPGDQDLMVQRWQADPGVTFDHRFLAHPDQAKRVYLNDVVERIEVELDQGWNGQPIPGLSADRLQTINTPTWRRR